jgi:hypothetical protein
MLTDAIHGEVSNLSAQKQSTPVMILCPQGQFSGIKHRSSDDEIQLAVRVERHLQFMILNSIRVHICENELQLMGSVGSWHEKQQAQEAARLTAPAYRIRNELCVNCTSGHIAHVPRTELTPPELSAINSSRGSSSRTQRSEVA